MSGEVLLKLFIPGRPRTKGSLKPGHKRGMGGRPCKVYLTESGEYAAAWKNEMIQAIKRDGFPIGTSWPYAGPVEVHSFFRFARVAADFELDFPVRQSGELAHGDEDKLRRNLLDALTQSGLISDDSNVVGGYNLKRFCDPGEVPGVDLLVRSARSHLKLIELVQLDNRPAPVDGDE
jgi:hypothetical protein